VGVWFRASTTGRYLYLLRNDNKHPGAWGLADGQFEYNTWVCATEHEFCPELNHEHLGYAWIDAGTWPKPMHPGLWNTVNIEAVQGKIETVERYLAAGTDR